jgi:hypothetical protein
MTTGEVLNMKWSGMWSLVALVGLGSPARAQQVDLSWSASRGGAADSIARGMKALIGQAPALLAGCGPHHVIVAYLNAPGDIRAEISKTAAGVDNFNVSMAQQRRNTVGAVIASVYFDIAGIEAADTVTVELVRSNHRPSNVGPDREQFAFVQNPNTSGPFPPLWVNQGAGRCERVI